MQTIVSSAPGVQKAAVKEIRTQSRACRMPACPGSVLPLWCLEVSGLGFEFRAWLGLAPCNYYCYGYRYRYRYRYCYCYCYCYCYFYYFYCCYSTCKNELLRAFGFMTEASCRHPNPTQASA